MITLVKLIQPLVIDQNNVHRISCVEGLGGSKPVYSATLDNPRQRFIIRSTHSGEEFCVPMVNVAFYQEKEDPKTEKATKPGG